MKLAFLSAFGEMGGAERSLYDVLASLRAARRDWDLNLIVPSAGALAEHAARLGVGTTVVEFPRTLARLGDAAAGGPAGKTVGHARLLLDLATATPGVLLYLRRLRYELRRIAPDVLHANGLKPQLLSALARTKGRPAVVWHVHDYVGARPLTARLIKLCASRCATAVVNSRSVAADLRAVCGDELRTHLLYNAVDLDNFSPRGSRLDLDTLAGLPPAEPGTVRVGLLATMARWKGHETFLKSLSMLPTDARVRGYVIGGAVYRTRGSQLNSEELRACAARLGLEGRVGFTGFVEDAASAIRALDVLVHASTEPEPFGLAIVEGMACGRSVVASRAGGAAEILEGCAAALSHAPGDADDLSVQIGRLARSAELRAQLGREGRLVAERRFDRARLAEELAGIYEEATRAV
ncbi:MAG TPA: glycosyltransferase family 4 protein [Pyrinomonadaceae bacterium]